VDFLELAVTVQHAATVSKLKDLHRDPFDRILIAQAMNEPLTFLTADFTLREYSDLVELV
jgi:PIN domain nuclease of toxin-antitoxin system